MDEIKYKLNCNNVMVVTEAISLLLKNVAKLTADNKNSGELENFFTLLQEQCTSSNSIISSTACHGFLQLLKDGFLNIDTSLCSMMPMVLSVESYSGVISIVSGILAESVLQDVKADKSYTCRWEIMNPTHPFIFILKQKKESIDEVINAMEMMCSPDSNIYEYSLELLRPVFIWILCNRNESYGVSERKNALNIILDYKNTPEQHTLLMQCLLFQNTSCVESRAWFQLYSSAAKWANDKAEYDLYSIFLPIFANLVHVTILYGDDPRPCFKVMENILKSNVNHDIISCTLGLIAESVLICPAIYLFEMLSLCNMCCEKNNSRVADYMLISAILQWDYNKNILTQNFNDLLREILNVVMEKSYNNLSCKPNSDVNELFNFLKSVNTRIFRVHEMCINTKNIIVDRDSLKSWIDKWKRTVDLGTKYGYLLYFQSLLLLPLEINDELIKIDILRVIVEIIQENPDSAYGQLPITLYCLRISNSPVLTVELLKSFPVLASLKESIPIVMGIFKSIENKKNVPKSFIIELYIKLYDHQNRCFPYLQAILAENFIGIQDVNVKWETLTAQAQAAKRISETSAESHGLDLVPILTEIINRSDSADSTAACCLSIEAVTYLWKAEIIDPISTWQVFGPRFHNEKRDSVKISICNLLATVPLLRCDIPEYDDFIDRCILRLWKYTDDSHSFHVNKAAFEALSNYKLRMLTLKQFPDKYKEGVMIPSNLLKLEANENQKPEDVLDYIPCIVWENLFKYTRVETLPGVVDLCYSLLKMEISGYRSGVYEIHISESESAKYLPNFSIVRGLLEYVRKEIPKTSKTVDSGIINCIKCLNMPFGKPLPPLNWYFMSHLILNDDLIISLDEKVSAMKLLANLSGSSPSAMKLITTYLESLDTGLCKDDDIQIISVILPIITKTVKISTLSSIIENCFEQYFILLKSSNLCDNRKKFDKTLLEDIDSLKICVNLLESISNCIDDKDIQIAIKNLFCKFLLGLWNSVDQNSVIWEAYTNVFCHLPFETVQNLLTSRDEKSNCLRCKLATDSVILNPLDFLNDLIDVGVNDANERNKVLSTIVRVLTKTKSELKSTKDWVLQLKLNIDMQMSSSREELDMNTISFLLDIVMLSVIILSQHCVLNFDNNDYLSTSYRFSVFPQAFGNLFRSDWVDVGCQLLEWLHYCRLNEAIDETYRKIISTTLVASKHSPNFEKDRGMWEKYVSPKLNITFL